MVANPAQEVSQLPTLDRSPLAIILRGIRSSPVVMIGLVIVVVWTLLILAAPLLAPVDPLQQSIPDRLTPPNQTFLMGTDELGRDIFSRVLYGGRITIPAAIAVVVLDAIIGSIIGALAGYFGGYWDELMMRLTELFMAFPTIILAMAVTAALGPDIQNAVLALVIVRWPTYARLTRSLVLEAKHEDYVEAARSLGASHFYILSRTLLPNTIAPAIVYASLDVGNAILLFAGLSFLGLGPEPASPEWGRMVSIGIDFFAQWWMWLFPGMAIAILVMAFNFIGDGMRDILDPRTRD